MGRFLDSALCSKLKYTVDRLQIRRFIKVPKLHVNLGFGWKRSVVGYTTKITHCARSHDLFPGPSGAREKNFPPYK